MTAQTTGPVDGYYVIEVDQPETTSTAKHFEVWQRTNGKWYRPGDEQACPDSWIKMIVRRVRVW